MKSSTLIAAFVLCASISPLGLAAGNQLSAATQGDQFAPEVARAANGASVIVWAGPVERSNLTEVFARRYNASGEPLGQPIQVNQETRLRQYKPRVGIASDGSFIVAWLSEDNAPRLKVLGRRFDAQGQPMGPEFRIDSDDSSTITVALDIAMNDQGQAVVVYGTRKTIGGLADLDVRTIRGRQISPDGELGREFRAALNPLPELRAPAVAMAPSGEFVIVWQADGGQKSTTGIYSRRYRATGRPYGPLPRRVTQHDREIDAYDAPAVTMGADGQYSVAWASYRADTTPISVFVRRFNTNGRPVDGMQQIDSGLTQPAIAADGQGQLSLTAVDSSQGIVFRHLDASGQLLDSTTVEQRPQRVLAPSIGVDSNGRSLIAWQDFGRDGDGIGVFAAHDIH